MAALLGKNLPRGRMGLYSSVAASALFLALASAGAQEKLLWGELKPGAHAVGFRMLYVFDPTRQYDPPYEAAAARIQPSGPRPILIAQWYPAQRAAQPAMKCRDYLDVATADPLFRAFAVRLAPHMRDVVCDDIFTNKAAKLSPLESKAFERFLDCTTLARKDARPEKGRFPIVIYHPGLGGSLEDNSVLFEYLASHGFVVLSSAYPRLDASDLNIDWDLDRSLRDMDCLVRHAQGLPFADIDRLASMGHSYGAQAALAWRAEPASPVAAVVSIDSTVENVGIDYPGFTKLKSFLDARRGNIHAPLLRFASKKNEPKFATLEPYLKSAPRYEATVAGLEHNDYLTHGEVRDQLLPGRWHDVKDAAALRLSYQRVCEHILLFLDAYLNQSTGAHDSLRHSLKDQGPDGQFVLRFKAPDPLPPTARQLVQVIEQRGMPGAAALLRSIRPEIGDSMLARAGTVLMEEGRTSDAAALFALSVEFFPTSALAQENLGNALAAGGDSAGAEAAYKKCLERIAGDSTLFEAQRSMLRTRIQNRLKK
jgi:hypothetical protein